MDESTAAYGADRRTPRRARVSISDLTLIVRPSCPANIAVFTDEERADADAYAAQFGVVVERLLG